MTLEEQVKMLTTALDRHGRHDDDCGFGHCICGFDAALAATAEPAPPPTNLTPDGTTVINPGKPITAPTHDVHVAVGPEAIDEVLSQDAATAESAPTNCSSYFERGLPCPCEVASREAREAKERAPTYSAQRGEHEGCYGADDLRKVAEAVTARFVKRLAAHGIDVEVSGDLDTIIAKAVGRETTPTGRVKTACPHDSDECHRIYIRERALTHALAGVSDPAALLAVFDEMRAALGDMSCPASGPCAVCDLLVRAAAVRGGR